MRLFLCACLIFPPGSGAFAGWNDDRPYSFNNPNTRINDFQRRDFNPLSYNYIPRIEPPSFSPYIQTFTMPDLAINMYSMKMPEITVRDIGSDYFSYKWEGNHFNPEMKVYDHYAANIGLNIGGQFSPNSVSMDLGNMKFEGGYQTPQSYSRKYQDSIGNSFKIDRFNQRSDLNPSYNSFIQFYQREAQMSQYPEYHPKTTGTRPKPPTMELLEGFDEKWALAARDPVLGKQTQNFEIRIDSIKNDSNLSRFITEYSGTIRQPGKSEIEFTVKSPHENDGRLMSLDITLKGKGAPTATISWRPVANQDGGEAFKLIRDNLPIPLLVGPRASFRLNDVDVAESPLKMTAEGNISPKQLGVVKDLVNLVGRDDLGINTTFSPPASDSPKAGFSFGNAVKNLWYMVTGRWSEVKSLRQDMAAMQKNDPGKFVLAAGFSDPGFLGIADLRSALRVMSEKENPVNTVQRETSPQIPKNEINIPAQEKPKGFFGKVGEGIKTTFYYGITGVFKLLSEAGRHTLGAIPDKYSKALYGKLSDDLKTDWQNLKIEDSGPEFAHYKVDAKDGTLSIGLHEPKKIELTADAQLSDNIFHSDRHQFIAIDDRLVAVIPAEGKSFSTEIRNAIEDGKIQLIQTPQEFQRVLNQNTVVVSCNGIQNHNKTETSPDMANLTNHIRQDLGLTNTIAPGLYNRGPVLRFLTNAHLLPEGAGNAVQGFKDVVTDGLEMLLPFSVQRDKVARGLESLMTQMQKSETLDNQLGVSPRVIFIGFSGGGQPSQEVASYLGSKASFIGLDSPLVENDMSRIRSFTFIHSSFVGSLYEVGKTPADTKIIEYSPSQSAFSLMNVGNHLIFFDDGGINMRRVLDAVIEQVGNGLNIRMDELQYRRRN